MNVAKKWVSHGLYLCILLVLTIPSCIENNHKNQEKLKVEYDKTQLRFNWFLTETSKHNYTTSLPGVIIYIEIENLTDSIFYLSNKHGDFFVKNKQNENVKFFSGSSFNSKLIYPHSKIELSVRKTYYSNNKTEPSENDFLFDLQYELRDSIFDKKSFYNNILDSKKHLIDTTKLFLVGNKHLHKTTDYKFEWLSKNKKIEE